MTEFNGSWEQRAVDEEIEDEIRRLIHSLKVFHYCPKCGKILSERRTPIWSHDHSLEIGYTLKSECVFCGYFEIYTDVE